MHMDASPLRSDLLSHKFYNDTGVKVTYALSVVFEGPSYETVVASIIL